jgi:predicted dehydrogenase
VRPRLPSPAGIGLIGLGRHGRRYADHLHDGDIPGARLVAVCRRNLRAGARDAKRYGVALAPSPDALCQREDVDIVVVVVPPGLYPPIVAAAAAAHKPTLLEKPLAADVRGARRILSTMRRARLPAMVAHTLRFDPRVLALRRAVRRLGTVRAALGVHRLEARDLAWETDAAHGPGGILHQTGTHMLDLLRFVTGLEVERLSCRLARVANAKLPDLATIRCELEGGALAQVAASKVSAGRSLSLEIVGDRGIARADLIAGRLEVSVGGGAKRPARRLEQTMPAVPTVPLALHSFLRAVRRNEPPPIPLSDAGRSHALVETALASARRGGATLRPIQLGG